jgi:hypothetical protein
MFENRVLKMVFWDYEEELNTRLERMKRSLRTGFPRQTLFGNENKQTAIAGGM